MKTVYGCLFAVLVSGCGLGGGTPIDSAAPAPNASSDPQFAVTPSGTDATSSPSVAQTVNANGTVSFTVSTLSGYDVDPTVTGTCAAGSWSGSVYTTGAVTADCSVQFNGAPKTVYLYESAAPTNGNVLGDRNATTLTCQNSHTSIGGSASCTHHLAILGYAADNGIQDIKANYGIPVEGDVKALDGTVIAASFQNMIDTLPPLMAGTFGIPDSVVWSGFNAGGTHTTGGTCGDWTATGMGTYIAFINSMNQAWANGAYNCTFFSKRILCACW